MKTKKGFTLIELMLALSLGSFVILAMMESYRGVIRYLERSRSMMQTNRQVCLFFNQIERDFSTAYIPELHDVIPETKSQGLGQSDGKKSEKEDKKPDKSKDKKHEAAEKEKLRKTFFMASIDEQADSIKINGKRKKAFKDVNFICSHPFQVYGQKQVNLVRVNYQLIKDKAASKQGPAVYQLWRKETAQLLNTKLKEDDQVSKHKAPSVKKYMVADNIKSMVVEFATFKKEDKKKKVLGGKPKPPQEISFFTWGDKKETAGVVPRQILIWIDLWNDRKTSEIRFHALFPVYSYPTEEKEDEAKARGSVAGEVGDKKPDEQGKVESGNEQSKGQAQEGSSQRQPDQQIAGQGATP